ncbi:hypothetical protein DCAR_0100423 [Daucus carota subsp. sativus]|uniref:Late embryogenesis abundant protein LEA-2 subgroup domain-containing protein n=1 Tax=Daucus carota subsp. sativus TaxID=79200 RepID=A0A166FN39_DAUCS|nr:PREDICTED: uncharacterized protein LOC108216042 [Daucus carota subsp. sativus]WOG81277.1 hypothetical protein DCAR_0100423 [Daucus carota subsp. sativus]
MANRDQETPLAPEAHRIAMNVSDNTNNNDNNNNRFSPPIKDEKRNRSRCLKCCGCTTIVLTVLGVTILILALTVFKAKDPKVNLNYVRIKGLETVTAINLVPNTNLTIEVELSIKNPNAVAFKFKNVTTGIYYDNVLIGEAYNPKGTAKANKTFRVKVTVDVLLQSFLRIPRFLGDLAAREVPVTTRSNIRGKVEIIEIIKKTVGVKLNCALTVTLADQNYKDLDCKRSVSI